jgi:hypothetical protein
MSSGSVRFNKFSFQIGVKWMNEKLIAVAVEEHGNIAPQAGRAMRWQVYVVSMMQLQVWLGLLT